MYGLIPTKPEDVCLTLIRSQMLLGVSAPTICACTCTARISVKCICVPFLLEVHSARQEQSSASTKVTLLNLSGKGRGVK